jgi:K+/H+ antiporter YhaU regulatory subunit KhtT
MTTPSLDRVKKEFWITVAAFREVVLTVAERVNRRVQVMRLQWHMSALTSQIEAIYQQVGGRLTDLTAKDNDEPAKPQDPALMEKILQEATPRLGQLRDELAQVTVRMRELEIDTLTEDLLKFQQDLASRLSTIERVVVARGATVIGQSVPQLGLSLPVRVAAVFRGTTALTVNGHSALKAGDVVVLVGPRTEVKQAASWFTEGHPASA